MPAFVLYEDGTVIYDGAKEPGSYQYFTVKLTPEEVVTLLESIQSAKFESYRALYTHTDRLAITDLPSPFVMLRRKDGSYKTIKTYGTLGERGNPDYRVLNMPDSLRNAFNFLWKYDNPKATNWQSDFAEFVFWKYEGDSNKNVTWPKIEDIYKVSFKDGDEEFYSIFISESMEKPYAQAYWKARRKRAALKMDGKRWDFQLRFPFPWERVWMGGDDGKIFRDGR
ncbi:MAG: hypothetical protein IPK01_15370 [Acidobacteria bacterium]|nr:hypothetical protein [Acidobacteriota bacterium]